MEMNEKADTYKTIAGPSEGFFKDKGSKFYAFAYPVLEEEEIKGHLDTLRKKFHDARHHVYSWILKPDKSLYRINDDGEPSGSSGKPIHGQFLSYDLTNILIVVIRYFGGTKLGIPGLINAYRTAAKEAIENAEIIEKKIWDLYEVCYGYPLMNDVMRIMKEENIQQNKQEFLESCRIEFQVRQSDSQKTRARFEQIYGVDINFLKTF